MTKCKRDASAWRSEIAQAGRDIGTAVANLKNQGTKVKRSDVQKIATERFKKARTNVPITCPW